MTATTTTILSADCGFRVPSGAFATDPHLSSDRCDQSAQLPANRWNLQGHRNPFPASEFGHLASSNPAEERRADGAVTTCPKSGIREGQLLSTAECWIHRLHSALQETQRNLELILSSYRQLERCNQQLRQRSSDIASERKIKQRSMAVQTEGQEPPQVLTDRDSAAPETPTAVVKPAVAVRLLRHQATSPFPPAIVDYVTADHRYPDNSKRVTNGRRRRPRRQEPSMTPSDELGSFTTVRPMSWKMTRYLSEAWELAGLHTRQRMTILGRHYRRLYGRHRRLTRRHRLLKRFVRRSLSRCRYLQHQHQILLESIGQQVDDVASDWADQLKGLVEPPADGRRATSSPPPLDFSTWSSPAADESPLSSSSNNTDEERRRHAAGEVSGPALWTTSTSATTSGGSSSRSRRQTPSSLYRWYSALSLKLSWLKTSHRTIVDNILFHI